MDWQTWVLGIGGPALVAIVGAFFRWFRTWARDADQRIARLETQVRVLETTVQNQRGDLRDLRRTVLRRR
jgi:hypothetical protein